MATTATMPRSPRRFWALVALGGAIVIAGLFAAHVMEERGHIVTGMNNRIVWGMPHVFAIFLIVAASGVLNVASVGSVFGHAEYKARAPLSGLLCLALLVGGLTVLMLDLGRPERIVVAATHYNFKSVFAWNMFLYTGMAAIVAVYLWTLMERRFNHLARPVGIAAFAWRIILTSGTGSIFAFLIARQAYGTAVLVPLFLAMSFAWGLAVFLLAQSALSAANGRPTPIPIRRRMGRLLALFVATVLLLVAAYHLTNLYFARQCGIRALHPGRWRRLPAALLVGLRRRRQCRTARAALASALWHGQARSRRGAAGDRRRVRAAVRVHHRRARPFRSRCFPVSR